MAVDYSKIEVPVDRIASDEARDRGRALFRAKCALCHGVRADGHGARRQGLSGQPANFQSREWRANTGPRRIYRVLSEGKRGTSMPAWPTLSDEEKWEVVAYVLGVSEDGP
ncbi:MAG: cytochrome c [Deltaproteobacteria bacterium]|nr:cytochrome c [Deltaproteobacteria bacterium]